MVVGVKGSQIKVGFEAPRSVIIDRCSVRQAKLREEEERIIAAEGNPNRNNKG